MIYVKQTKYKPLVDEAVLFWIDKGYSLNGQDVRVRFSNNHGESMLYGAKVAGMAYKDQIMINLPMIEENNCTLLNVITHEMGHILGRVDNSMPDSIMNADTNVISKYELKWYNK